MMKRKANHGSHTKPMDSRLSLNPIRNINLLGKCGGSEKAVWSNNPKSVVEKRENETAQLLKTDLIQVL
jgi:hypothetical protein